MPDEDLLKACLLHAKRYCSDIDIDSTNASINVVVESVSRGLAGNKDPRNAIGAINKYLFDELSLRATGQVSTSTLLPDRILQRKEGHCLGLSLIYAAVAQRLGLPVCGRIVPNHFWLRYDDGRHAFNIETTESGAERPDTLYLSYLPPSEDLARSVYVKNLSNAEFLAVFLTNLGACLEQKKDASRAHKQASALFPKNPEILINAGEALLSLGKNDNAIENLTKALELDPALWQAHGNLAACYFNIKEYKKAADSYLKAIDLVLSSLTITAYVQGLPQNADPLETARRFLRDESASAPTLAGLGILAYRQEECQLADALFERALQLDPSNRDWNSLRAVLCLRRGDFDAARRHSVKASAGLDYKLRVGPQFVIDRAGEFYSGLGKSYAMSGKYDLATEAFGKALDIAGPRAEFYSSLGGAYWLKGDKAGASECYEKALKLDPSDSIARQKLAELKKAP